MVTKKAPKPSVTATKSRKSLAKKILPKLSFRKKVIVLSTIACALGTIILVPAVTSKLASNAEENGVLGWFSNRRKVKGPLYVKSTSTGTSLICIAWKTNLRHNNATEIGLLKQPHDPGESTEINYLDITKNYVFGKKKTGFKYEYSHCFTGLRSGVKYTLGVTLRNATSQKSETATATTQGSPDNNDTPVPSTEVNNGKITYAKWYNKNSKEARLIGGDVAQIKYMSDTKQDGYTIKCNELPPRNFVILNKELTNKYNSDTYRISNEYFIYSGRLCYVSGYKYFPSKSKNIWGPQRLVVD